MFCPGQLQLLQSQEFSKTREELVEAQTSRKHLEEKVDDLIRQLKGNEEKLAVYERRSGLATASQLVDQELGLEHQLETEVADLRYVVSAQVLDGHSLYLSGLP